MRHIKHWLATMATLLCSLTTSAYDFAKDGIYYDIISSADLTVEVAPAAYYFGGYEGEVVIPSIVAYNGKTYRVTGIGTDAFGNCSSLTSITMPEGVTIIGIFAFSGCSNLTSVTLPENLMSIGDYAFSHCSNLTSITIPESVTNIGEYVFRDCSSLASITIRDGVTSIGNYTFSGCSNLTSVSLPENLMSIGDYAFSHCSNLTSIIIPNGVTSIGSSAFSHCSNLTSIIIPNGVESIGGSAFYNCNSLTSITLPEGLAIIGYYTFSNCSSLTSITISGSVTNIGDYAFEDCISLTAITIPEGVTTIGKHTFEDCSGLISIAVADGNTIYDSREHCNAIIETRSNVLIAGCSTTFIPEGVESIGDYAFVGRSNLTSITIPEGVTSIGGYAFRDCSSLTSIIIPESVTSIGDDAFSGTAWYSNLSDGTVYLGTILYRYKGLMPENTHFEIKEGITGISGNAFAGQSGLVSIAIPNSVVSIGRLAFSGCTGLKEIVIPGSVEYLSYYAFDGCSNLEDVTFAEGVVSVGDAFRGCVSIRNISIPSTMTDINTNFSDSKNIKSITVAEGNPIYSSPQGCNAIVKSGVLVLGCKATTIPSSVYRIGANSFNAIDTLSIPEGVRELEDNAFSDCDTIRKISIPSSITQWGDFSGPFAYCVIDTMYLNNNNTCLLGYYEDHDCLSDAKINHMIIGEGVTRITNLTLPKESLTIPSTLKELGDRSHAWYGTGFADRPKQVHVKDLVTWLNIIPSGEVGKSILRVSGSIYYEGKIVKNLSIPKEVKTIRSYAFYSCDSLESVVLHDSITEIGIDAFYQCSNLRSIVSLSRTAPKVYRYVDNNSFKGISKDAVLYYPQGCDYSSWAKYIPGGMQELPNRGVCGENLMWHFDETTGNLNFYGAEAMTDYMSAETPWYKYVRSITTVTIDERVTSVGDYAFYGCRGLDTIYCYAKVPPAIEKNTFYNVNRETCVLMVPQSAYDEYWWHPEWGEFLQIKKIGVVEKYKITYMVDGKEYLTDSIAFNKPIVPAEEPTKEGYAFSGWSEIPEMMPAQDVVINGFFAINKYLVTFVIDDEVIASDLLEYGSAIVAPEVPAKEGHTFKGWSEVPAIMPAEEVIISGSFTVNTYKVYYYVGEELVHTAEVAYGASIPEYVYEPTAEGDEFMGWVGETYETMPAHDVTYTANIANDISHSTISDSQLTIYDLNGRKIETDDLRELEEDIYIVNGKKVVIK